MLLISLAYALDADTLEPPNSALAGQSGLQLVSPTIGAPNGWYVGTALVYAHNPVVYETEDGVITPVVQSQFGMHLAGGYTFGILEKQQDSDSSLRHQRSVARLDLDLPIYPYVSAPDADYRSFSAGDLRVAGVFPIARTEWVDFGLAPYLTLPTGAPKAYTGAGSVGGGLNLALAIQPIEDFSIRANLGAGFSKASDLGDFSVGSVLWWGLGGTYVINPTVDIYGELDGNLGIAGGIGPYNQNPTELHAGVGIWPTENIRVMTGLGTGVVAGIGAPDIRVVAGISWVNPGFLDADGDGLEDGVDDCPNEAEDPDGYNDMDGCPDKDNDEDGILDTSDKCPNDREDRDGYQDSDGCPELDNDTDGLPDMADACPNEPGPQSTVGCPDTDQDAIADNQDECPNEPGPIKYRGCPDRDSDQVPDPRDKCPDQPKDPAEDPARSDGCVHRVFVAKDRIEIREVIYFDTGKSTIKAESLPLIDEIARVLIENPDITLLEIGGHTDSQGKDSTNLRLSQGRADAVKAALVARGVEASRLISMGYGETRPIDTNSTTDGRAKNRRVELLIKERKL